MNCRVATVKFVAMTWASVFAPPEARLCGENMGFEGLHGCFAGASRPACDHFAATSRLYLGTICFYIRPLKRSIARARAPGETWPGKPGKGCAPNRGNLGLQRLRTMTINAATFKAARRAALGVTGFVLAGMLSACAQQQPPLYSSPYPPAQPQQPHVQPSVLAASPSVSARPVRSGGPTGTFVGAKVLQLRGDLQTMQRGLAAHSRQLRQGQASTVANAGRYHQLVAAINARLQVGTTRGNPILTSQLAESQGQLARIDADVARMGDLAARVSTDSALAGYLLESVRAAYNLSGAVEEDHRQLAILEDEVNRTVILIDRLLSEINTDVTRQTAYVARERQNITTLALAVKNGEAYGGNLSVTALGPAARAAPRGFGPAANFGARIGRTAATSRPLVVIRFDRATVDYEQPLYRAISEALSRRPSASFEIEAAAPASAASPISARRQAERVTRTLIEMGVPRNRLALSERIAPDARTDEVRIYVR